MNLQNRLFLSLAIMGLAALAIGAISLFTLREVFENQSKVYNSALAVYHLKKISNAYGIDVVNAVKSVQNGQAWGWEEGSKTLTEASKTADENWNAYLAMDKSKDEKMQSILLGSMIDTNKHLMEDLQNDFATKDLRDLTIQAGVLDPSVGPILDSIRKIEDMEEQIGQDAIAHAEKGFNDNFEFLIGVVVVLLLAGLVIGYNLGNGGIRSMGLLSRGFLGNADQVASHSDQVSAAATQLSAQLLESAAQLQKLENTVEKLVFSAQQNKQEATLARHYVEETRTSISSVGESSQRVVNHIKNMGQGSERIFQVVKTIEEIAFQTNILALNAGVEAVRAGDQGKEFVLVVEEIRNLSQRCSQVARETSRLITDNVNQANEGARLSEETAKLIAQAFELSGKTASLLTVIESGLEQQAGQLHEAHVTAGNAQQSAHRTNTLGEKLGTWGSTLAQQSEGLRQVSRQLAGLFQGAPSKALAASKPAPAKETPAKVTAPVESGDGSVKEAKVMERTGTDAKVVHIK